MRKALAAIGVMSLTISLTSAYAADGPYKLDAKGNCHDSSGKMALSPCAPFPPIPTPSTAKGLATTNRASSSRGLCVRAKSATERFWRI